MVMGPERSNRVLKSHTGPGDPVPIQRVDGPGALPVDRSQLQVVLRFSPGKVDRHRHHLMLGE